MSFGIEYEFVETDQVRRREDEIKVFECLGHPEALFQCVCQ